MFCREQAVQLHREVDEIRGRGAELVFVGNGNRHFAKAFKEDLGLDEPLYVDTKLESYRALGMRRGFFATLGSLDTWSHTLRALRGGFRQGFTRGDAWQVGGLFVVLPEGRIAYRYLSRSAGDHPPVAEVLSALPRS